MAESANDDANAERPSRFSGVITLEAMKRTLMSIVDHRATVIIEHSDGGSHTISIVVHPSTLPLSDEATVELTDAMDVIEAVFVERKSRGDRWRN